MFKKFSSNTLIIILVVLCIIVALNKFYFSKKSESTFSNEFVTIDTSLITKILIYPKAENGKEIILTRNANQWEVSNDKMKAHADSNAIRNLVSNFASIKSASLAGADKSSWKELQIDDSSGSRIKIMTSDNQTYDMVVGKFGYNATSRNGISYIRHANEESVYAVDGFLTFSVNQPISAWRNKTFISGNKDNWNSLTFTYPGDSSFVMIRKNGIWGVNGELGDSVKINQYLNTITTIHNADFAEHYSPVTTPLFSLSIEGNNMSSPLVVYAYPSDSTQKFILHSSLNPEAYFVDGKNNMTERVFVSGKSLLR